ncbi:Uncharacterized membrane protein [Parapedobacter luteus]|uniref:Uncharacterized membrane protein n=1 Tax=Parapedobacter luteus TaxID=623280 RepID=A0A1T5ELC5_9SPHI|nr:DUF819 family protein [Parapedobacter luteus]SKB84659.1 Uncharacterized membrane protein [Parapedobacter luteus]
MDNTSSASAWITDDVAVFGLLMVILAVVFYTSNSKHPGLRKFYAILPPLLLCYFVPGLFNSFGVISGSDSQLYSMSSNYLLPACLVLFTLNINFREVWRLRKKAGLLFFTGMIGIVLGGPFAVWLFSLIAPAAVSGEVWRGLATLAGSWIGGGANQAALFRIFEPSPEIFAATVAVDVFVAYGWMAVLLYGAGKRQQLDRYFKASANEVEELTARMEEYSRQRTEAASTKDYMVMLGVAFGVTGIAHLLSGVIADYISVHAPQLDKFSLTSSFFWLIILATLMGVGLSFTKARRLETMGASRLATVFLYILVATIGMQMDIFKVMDNPALFLVGLTWLLFHASLLFVVAKLIKAPFFFLAIGSMGNIGGVASASVTAGAFHPSLVPVGVFIAVFSYAIGTYAGYLCGILMQWVAP